MKTDPLDQLTFASLGLVVLGLGLWSVPLALVVLGTCGLLVGLWGSAVAARAEANRTAKEPPPRVFALDGEDEAVERDGDEEDEAAGAFEFPRRK
jgi:hypothetical protein